MLGFWIITTYIPQGRTCVIFSVPTLFLFPLYFPFSGNHLVFSLLWKHRTFQSVRYFAIILLKNKNNPLKTPRWGLWLSLSGRVLAKHV